MGAGMIRRQVKVGTGANALRDSGMFRTRREAEAWAVRRREELMAKRDGTEGQRKTLLDALRRYAEEVAPTHKGERWEVVRLASFEGHALLPLTRRIVDVTPEQIERWRAWRETKVSAGSVRRELSLLGSVFTAARRWKWVKESPMQDVSRPSAPPGRDVTLTREQIKGMLKALGYRRQRPQTMQQVVAHMMLLGLRTGMRSGEMEGLLWANVQATHVTLPRTKNGDVREVPIPRKARAIFERMRGWDDVRVFPIGAQSRDALWRAARDRAGLSGFRFHDLRHTAATWIGATVGQSGKLSFPQFCRVFGWRDPKYALVYVNPSAADLADLM